MFLIHKLPPPYFWVSVALGNERETEARLHSPVEHYVMMTGELIKSQKEKGTMSVFVKGVRGGELGDKKSS